jgi:ArsR family transcriptional regulator
MAAHKKPEFEPLQVELADFARVLSHPARLVTLQVLSERKSCICGEIVEVLPLAQSTVSQHLKEMKNAGVIKGEVEGPRSCYCIDPQVLLEQIEHLQHFLNDLKNAITPEKCC